MTPEPLAVKLLASVGIGCLLIACAAGLVGSLGGQWWLPVATSPWWLGGSMIGVVILRSVWADD
jgi:hypothetical protein